MGFASNGISSTLNLFRTAAISIWLCAEDTIELTAGLSETLKGLCVAYRPSDDDFDGWSKIEEHANGGDQRVGGNLVVRLQRSRQFCRDNNASGRLLTISAPMTVS